MYNQDGFFRLFFSFTGALSGVSRCLRGGVPSLLLPTRAVGRGRPGERADRKREAVFGGEPPSPTHRCRSEGSGRGRKHSPCPKLQQHPRSSSPEITHTHLPETKTNTYCIVLLSAVLKIKRRTFLFGDSDCLQLKTPGSLFPSSKLPKLHLCTPWAEAALSKDKGKASSWKGEEVTNERGTRGRQRVAQPAVGSGGLWGAGGVLGGLRHHLPRSTPETSQEPHRNSASRILPALAPFPKASARKGHVCEHTCEHTPRHLSHHALPWPQTPWVLPPARLLTHRHPRHPQTLLPPAPGPARSHATSRHPSTAPSTLQGGSLPLHGAPRYSQRDLLAAPATLETSALLEGADTADPPKREGCNTTAPQCLCIPRL